MRRPPLPVDAPSGNGGRKGWTPQRAAA